MNLKVVSALISIAASVATSQKVLLTGSAPTIEGVSAYISADAPKVRHCPISDICVTAQFDASETCFTVHSFYQGWTAIGFSTQGMLNAEIYASWTNSTGGYTVASLQTGGVRIKPTQQVTQVARAVPVFDLPAPSFAKFSFAFCKPSGTGASITASQSYILAASTRAPTNAIDTADANFDVHNGPSQSFKVDFTKQGNGSPGGTVSGPILTPSNSFPLQAVYVLHGILMWIAWIVSPFIGIFIARFMKSKLGHTWYTLHRLFMGVSTILFTVAAFVLILLYKRPPHFQGSFHFLLGLLVTIGCILQGVLGYISNATFDPERASVPLVDFAHWWLGRLLFIAGIVNVYLGILIYEENGFTVSLFVKVIHFVVLGAGFALMAFGQWKYGQDLHVKNE